MNDQILISAIKSSITDVINESNTIKSRLGSTKRNLIQNIKNLNENDTLFLFSILTERKKPELTKDIALGLKMGLAAAAAILPGGLIVLAIVMYIKNAHNYKCELQCQKDSSKEDKRLCYYKCDISSLKYAIRQIEGEIGDCWYTKKPKKCHKKLTKILIHLKQKLVDAEDKLKHYRVKK